SNVDLPQPLGPTRQTKPPTLTLKETSSSACTSPPRSAGNRFETLSTASFAGGTFWSSSSIGIDVQHSLAWRSAPCQGVSKRRDKSGAVLMKPAFCELLTNA